MVQEQWMGVGDVCAQHNSEAHLHPTNLLWCTCRVKVGLALAVADTLVAFEAMFKECAAMLLPVSEASLQAAWHVFG